MKTKFLQINIKLCLILLLFNSILSVKSAIGQSLDNTPLSICNVPPGCQEEPICIYNDDCFRFEFFTPKDLGNGTSAIKIKIVNFSESTFKQATFELPGQGASTLPAIKPNNKFRNRFNHNVVNKLNDSLIAFNAINAGLFSYGGFEVYYYVVNNADLNAPYGRKIQATAHAGRLWQQQRFGSVVIDIDQCIPVSPCPKPTASIQGPDELCLFNDEPYTFTTNAIAGATYNWTAVNATIIDGQGTNTIQVVPDIDSGLGSVSVVVVNDCGSINDMYPFEVIDCGPIIPLPVELTTFTGSPSSGGISLNWTTASEKNNDRFEVERSADGRNFEKIGMVKGNGSTSSSHTYKYLDGNITGNLLYYRLKQIDLDGTHAYSKVISVKTDGSRTEALTVTMAPNPCQNQDCSVMLRGLDTEKTVTVTLQDLTGRTVLSKELPRNQASFTLPKTDSGSGIYILSVKNGSNTAHQKVILQQ